MTEPFETIKQELEKNPYIVRFQLSRHTVEMMLAEVERLQAENAELKAERRKFTECTSSNGCFDHDGNLHVHNGEFMSPSGTVNGQIFPRVAKLVWHREP